MNECSVLEKNKNVVLEKDGDQLDWSCVTNEQVLQTVKEKRNITEKIKRKKAKWIGHIVQRNYLPKHVTEEKI
jgi:uncharacterized protein YbaP (TraB family)